MIKLSVNSVLFGGFDYETAARYIASTGYDGIEIAALPRMAEHLVLDNWKEQADELLAINEKYGLKFTGTEAGVLLDEDRMEKAFQAAAHLGIPNVNVGSGGKTGSEEDFQEVIRKLKILLEKAEKYKVNLNVKPHVGSVIHDEETTLRMLDMVSSPYLGVNLDPSHLHRNGENAHEVFPKMASHVKHIHIRDCLGRDQGPGKPRLQICGRGDIDLYSYLKVIVESGYDGALSLEVIGANVSNPNDAWADDIKDKFGLEDVVAIAAESYGYLNAILKHLNAR